MENPRKHDKKKWPLAINIGAGAGGLGIGGIVLFGGALVTATIVSSLAYRSRSQRRSSSEKSMSPPPSPETQSVDAPNKLEFMMKTDKDFSAHSSPWELQNPSDEVTSMKEIQTKNTQSSTPDKKHDSGMDDEQFHSGDKNEDVIVSVVAEDQENTSIHVDSAFESKKLDNSYEKIELDSEEQVGMAVQIEKDSCLERDELDDGGEVQKHLMIDDDDDDENDAHVDANSLVSDEGVMSIEEYEAIEVPVKDTVSEASENEDEEGEEHQVQFLEEKDGHDEIVLDNCEGDLSDETGYADQIVHETGLLQLELQNCPQERLLEGQDEIILEKCEGDLSDKKGPANQIMREDDQQMECSSKQVMDGHEIAQEMHQVCESFVVACVMNSLKEAVDDQTTAKEDSPPSRLMNKVENDKETTQKVEEQVTVEDEAAKVDDQTDNPPSQLMNKDEERAVQVKVELITEHESVKKDEIPHVEPVKEDEDSEEDVTVKTEPNSSVSSSFMQEELTPEAMISNHKIEENMEEKQTILGKNHNDSDDIGVASEPWNLKLMAWSVLISVWCLCHWFSGLPFPELSLAGSLLFILILLGYRNRATYLVKYE